MSSERPTEKELLKSVLEPLLEDFQYWFDRSRTLLESERLTFFSAKEQTELLNKIVRSKKEVSTAQILLKATNGEVGIDSNMLLPWHQLVVECWDLARKRRQTKGDRLSDS
ncbi:DUF2605 domain-containing protein [Myxosarcina sp. GI1]|uniref:DUF2605 domain-containing protein n=1 Tax=Myxosarcina sp. GI1 TaxID=1541065 RepID=UPI00056A30EC|nr:DUF2605 domain-containing protein [Myxosarcina sp. GI1]